MGTSRVVKSSKKHVGITGLLCAVVLGLTVLAGPVLAVELIGSDWDGIIYDINVSTGAATNPRATGIENLSGIAFSPDNVLYGISGFGTEVEANAEALFIIDPLTGSSTRVGQTELSGIGEGDLDFSPEDGLLYGSKQRLIDGDHLFTISEDTGVGLLLGVLGGGVIRDISGLVMMDSGMAYALDTRNEALVNLDPASGTINSTVSLSLSLGSVAGMEHDVDTGIFYVVDGRADGTDSLYTLDPNSGTLFLIGSLGLDEGLSGLAIIPEPATLVICLLAATFLLKRRC